MKFRFLLTLLFCLSLCPSWGQTTVTGRVLDQKTKNGLPGVTIYQPGTSNGTSSDSDGYFTLSVPVSADSVNLQLSYLGYVTQRHKVAPGSKSEFRLAADNKVIGCDFFPAPRFEAGINSGIRYAPFGASLKLHGQRLIRLPLSAAVSYQTNLRGSLALTASLSLPALFNRNRLSVTEALGYQQLRAAPANLRFTSYSATFGLHPHVAIGRVLMPSLLLGVGHASSHPLRAEAPPATSGYGYSIGLTQRVLPSKVGLLAFVQASRWPGYWQWQGRLTVPFHRNFETGLAFHQIQRYREVSILLSRTFY